MRVAPEKYPLRVYVAGARPYIQAELERAIKLWNDAVGSTVLIQAPDGAKDAVPIRLANLKNEWYGFGTGDKFAPDEEAEYTGMTGQIGEGQVRGTPAAFREQGPQRPGETPLTLAHELGHALGLFHPYPTSTADEYIPATYHRVFKQYEHHPIQASHVAPVGIMGNEMNPNKPGYRGNGPSAGEIAFLREKVGYVAPPRPTSGAATWDRVRATSPPLGRRALDRFVEKVNSTSAQQR